MAKVEQKEDGEIVIESPFGGAVAVAIRTAEDHKNQTFRTLITIRAGTLAKDISFNFGSYDGPTTKGGSPGDPPTCP